MDVRHLLVTLIGFLVGVLLSLLVGFIKGGHWREIRPKTGEAYVFWSFIAACLLALFILLSLVKDWYDCTVGAL